jgi:hypothetical protein
LRALLRKRVEVYTWFDSPVKQAYLAKINRMIQEHRAALPNGIGPSHTR